MNKTNLCGRRQSRSREGWGCVSKVERRQSQWTICTTHPPPSPVCAREPQAKQFCVKLPLRPIRAKDNEIVWIQCCGCVKITHADGELQGSFSFSFSVCFTFKQTWFPFSLNFLSQSFSFRFLACAETFPFYLVVSFTSCYFFWVERSGEWIDENIEQWWDIVDFCETLFW